MSSVCINSNNQLLLIILQTGVEIDLAIIDPRFNNNIIMCIIMNSQGCNIVDMID